MIDFLHKAMSGNYIDTADFRYQALTTIAQDWKSPFTGILHKKGSIVEFSAIVKYSGNLLLSFPVPNAAAMYLKLSHYLFEESQQELVKAESLQKGRDNIAQINEIPSFFDLLEKRLASIIFAYTAVEVFANQTIPDKYVYEKEREDGRCKETYTKEQAERWISLDEKLGELLPKALVIKTPRKKQVWSNFKQLKKIRDRLIHPKTKDLHSTGVTDTSIWNIIASKNLENPSLHAKNIISYFIATMQNKPRWFIKLPF